MPQTEPRNPQVTVILTLKGRELFTLRWLWHANRTKLPFHILIADGEPRPPLSTLLKNKSLFPNLSYEYLEFNDKSYSDYYKKCVQVASQVKTPYVRMSDNDDFIFKSGVLRDIDYLQNHAEYVCAQGGIAGFGLPLRNSKMSQLLGRISQLTTRYNANYKSITYSSSSVEERVSIMVRQYRPIFYAVYRREVLQKIFEEVVDYDFKDLQIHELFLAYRTLTLGKVESAPTHISYLRQFGTSLHSPSNFARRLVSGSYYVELQKVLADLAQKISALSQGAPDKILKNLSDAYIIFLTQWMYSNCKKRTPLYMKFVAVAKQMIAFYRRPFLFLRFHKQLCREGVDKSTRQAHRRELNEIQCSLQSKELAQFINQHAPDLLK